MILTTAEKNTGMLLRIVERAPVLRIWAVTGKINLTKNDLVAAQSERYSLWGIYSGATLVGCADAVFYPEHSRLDAALMLESEQSNDLGLAVGEIVKICSDTGIRKLNIMAQTELTDTIDIMVAAGFTLEARLRQQMWLGGRHVSVSLYGRLL